MQRRRILMQQQPSVQLRRLLPHAVPWACRSSEGSTAPYRCTTLSRKIEVSAACGVLGDVMMDVDCLVDRQRLLFSAASQ